MINLDICNGNSNNVDDLSPKVNVFRVKQKV